MICLLQLQLVVSNMSRIICGEGKAYYRLGKNRPGSGNFVRTSLSALTLHAMAVIPTMTAPIIAVFAFQFAGWEYHPPAGDHMCFGYLKGNPLLACWNSITRGFGHTVSSPRLGVLLPMHPS